MDDLIVMSKDGATLAVHPSLVKEHELLGWAVQAVQPDAKPVAAKPSKRNA